MRKIKYCLPLSKPFSCPRIKKGIFNKLPFHHLTKQGFTLIELLIVTIIIGILAAILIPNLTGKTREARIKRARGEIFGTISAALDMYEMDFGRYPQKISQLWDITEPLPEFDDPAHYEKRWNGPYTKKANVEGDKILDPWGRPYEYTCYDQGATYELYSKGPDSYMPEDDIVSDTGTEVKEEGGEVGY